MLKDLLRFVIFLKIQAYNTDSFINCNQGVEGNSGQQTAEFYDRFKLNSIISKDDKHHQTERTLNQDENVKRYQWDLWTVSKYNNAANKQDTLMSTAGGTTDKENVFANTNYASTARQSKFY